jgi:hypothetical protein
MNQNSGVYVFRNEHSLPILVAYKKMPSMRYLTLLHYSNVIFSYYSSYSMLLDLIPIRSIYLYVYLPIFSNKKYTIDKWYSIIVDAMEKY